MRKRGIWIVMCLALCLAASTIGGIAATAELTEMTDTVEEEFSFRSRIDPEEAERQYLNELFGLPVTPVSELPRLRGTAGGDSFDHESKEYRLYSALRNRVEQVAAGTLSSTQFKFEDEGFEAMSFSAGDLGMTAEELFGTDGKPTATASQRISEQVTPWVTSAINAVLYDCPYETFWRDTGFSISTSRTWYLNSQGEPTGPIVVGSVTVTIYVSAAYQNTNAGNASRYTVDNSRINIAINAVSNANAIISANASLSDYSKLTAYKDAICELTNYNKPAAGSSWTGGYGDPWQMVYVFDEDPETTVVCEGYSKAFYYLCDNSSWSSEDAVKVICVSGDMLTRKEEDSAWSGGGHMWNLVRMNGLNYLADITNTDSGNPGLFLDGYDRYDAENDAYFYESGVYSTGALREIGYSYDEEMATLFAADLLEPANTAAVPEPAGPTITIDKTSVTAGEEITITAHLPGAGRIRVGTQEGVFINDSFTEIQEGDTATWTTFFDYPGEYDLFVSGWSDERWNNPEIPNVADYPDMGGPGNIEGVTVTVTAQEEQGTLPEATVMIPARLSRYESIEVEIPEFPAAISYSVVCRRTDNREIAYSRTENVPFSTSISCSELAENVRYSVEVKVRRDGYASYVYYESFLIWAPIVPESITPGEDMVITLPPKEGADLYEICVETSSIIYYVNSAECGDFVIPAMVFADGDNGYIINIYAYRENDDPDGELPYQEMFWGTYTRGAEAYTGEETLTITAGAYDNGVQTINLSVTDAEQVIVQEKVTDNWGCLCWPTIKVTDNPGTAVDVSLLEGEEHEIRAAVKKNGVWSAWSPVIEVTTQGEETIEWTLSDDGILTIRGTGDMDDYSYENPAPWKAYGDRIESIVVESGITAIGANSFSNCANLTSVTIPSTVTNLKPWAFAFCESLQEIQLPEGITTLGEMLFYHCGLTGIHIPASVTELEYQCLASCLSMTAITVAEGSNRYASADGVLFTKDMGTLVVFPAGKSGNYTVPSSVHTIHASAFIDARKLTILTIPGTVTTIERFAFHQCSANEIILQEGIQTIGVSAFNGCHTGNDELFIPASVEEIGDYAFYMSYLENVEVSPDNPYFSSVAGSLYNKDCTRLVYPCYGPTSYEILQSVTSIAPGAFAYGSVTGVIIPDGVTQIPEEMFLACGGLTDVNIPAGVTSIDNSAFAGCENLSSLIIPDGVTTIGGGAFASCRSLTSLKIPAGVTSIGDYAFDGCNTLILTVYPDSYGLEYAVANNILYRIAGETISGTWGDLTWSLDDDGMLTISGNGSMPESDYGATPWFMYNESVQQVVIDAGITSIGKNAFCSCTNMTAVTIPDTVTSIGTFAFWSCSSLPDITIPDSVTSLADYAFSSCSGLTSLTIPGSVNSIGEGAFSYNNNLSLRLYPTRYLLEYAKDNGIPYQVFADNTLTIPSGTSRIEAEAFEGAACEVVIIPDGIESIGSRAFANCPNLIYVSLPADFTNYDESAFNCPGDVYIDQR